MTDGNTYAIAQHLDEREDWDALQEVTAELEQAEARIAELEAKLAKALEEKLDAISTLDAWFDRRQLAHAVVDKAVIDAASGYLRTSRVGGMSQEESDLILGVIEDMAHRSVFADLFARNTLSELSSVSCANLKGRDR